MYVRKIFGPSRIDGASGSLTTYALKPRAGGRMAKVAHYDIKVLACSDGANTSLKLTLNHSPDGTVNSLHSVAIPLTAIGSTTPTLLSGDADTSKVLSDYLHVLLGIQGTGGAQWAVVEVYEIRKPF